MRKSERRERLMPNGTPRWVRCYDNGGKTADRYTVLFTGRYPGRIRFGLCMSALPFHPQGVGQRFEFNGSNPPDRVGSSWSGPSIGRSCALGKRIRFEDLPADCQRATLDDYAVLWGLDS